MNFWYNEIRVSAIKKKSVINTWHFAKKWSIKMSSNTQKSLQMTPQEAAHIISQGYKRFIKYNQTHIQEFIRNLSTEKFQLFNTIPVLLHINAPNLPGYVDHPYAIYGIEGFETSAYLNQGLKHLGAEKQAIEPYMAQHAYVAGLYIMGSSGSLVQNDLSDFDYWILVDRKCCGEFPLKLLQIKLNRIKAWSKETYNQDVNFFVLDIDRLKKNEFSAVDEESSGTAQKTILKEEFYRTFTLISGKIPFWAVLPAGLNDMEYQKHINIALQYEDDEKFIKNTFIDLGNLSEIDKRECLGAIIWQMFKAKRDPVKSFIKASLITTFFFAPENELLPCDSIKKYYGKHYQNDYYNDPYTIVFDQVHEFFETLTDLQGLNVIRECIFLRLYGYPVINPPIADTPKDKVLRAYLERWGWRQRRVDTLAAYKRWPEQKRIVFEKKIFNRIPYLYELVLQECAEKKINMQQSDLQILKDRISVYFKPKPLKLPSCSAFLRARSGQHPLVIVFRCIENENVWSLFDTTESGVREAKAIFNSFDLVMIFGWIISNQLCKNNPTSLIIQSNTSHISKLDAKHLFIELYSYFVDRTIRLEDSQHLSALGKLAIVIVKDRIDERDLISIYFLYQNTNGEIFFTSLSLTDVENKTSKCYKINEIIQNLIFIDPVQTVPIQKIPYIIRKVGAGVNDPDDIIDYFIDSFKKSTAAFKNMFDEETDDLTCFGTPKRLLLDRY